MADLIFHLNSLVDSTKIRVHSQIGIAHFMSENYGSDGKWFEAYSKIVNDWASYHSDLNFSGEDGMAHMREARFRIMRALFRLAGKPEPSQDMIHALADEALKIKWPNLFGEFIHSALKNLGKQHKISLVSYFPQVQLEAIVEAENLQETIVSCIGADTFEQYEMNQRYFEMLLRHLKAKPEECIYIDKQKQVLEAASQMGLKPFPARDLPKDWIPLLKYVL
jgi:FMN phosphatase YigB (HAD superfamily)